MPRRFSPAIQKLVDRAEREASRRRGGRVVDRYGSSSSTRSLLEAALRHADRPGAGAAIRRDLGLRPREKVRTVMREFARGTLRSGSGAPVTDRQQAIAIAMSEAGLSKRMHR